MDGDQWLFEVEWVGHKGENTWEPYGNLNDTVSEYYTKSLI